MYDSLIKRSIPEQIEEMTKYLVQILSINGTNGEAEIADKIEEILRSFPYFKKHPGQVWIQPLPGDTLGRKNIFARLKSNGDSKKTVIFHSHIDTVGIEDFGKLKQIANSPDELLKYFRNWDGDKEIQSQALSGDWMFGRGALDMKSGIAVHLANILYFSEHLNEWNGQIIFMANPVEENQHTGVITAVEELLRLRKEERLEYLVAINNDYISPLYPGDEKKYIYTGAGGKLLTSFYIFGRETHVGQTLDGLDPTLVSSEINRLMNNNMDLAENEEGEMLLPPSCLYQRDTKDFYNVQTAVSSQLYFNVMVLRESPKTIMQKMKKIAEKAVGNIKSYYEEQYKTFSQKNHFPSKTGYWDLKVYTYEEYVAKLSKQGINPSSISSSVVRENPNTDPREICFKIIDALRRKDSDRQPCVVIFYAPPYCPHHYLIEEAQDNKKILETINEMVEKYSSQYKETFSVKRFFPYLTDSSYLCLHDTDEEISSLIHNFPEWQQVYPVPVDKIRELNIPAINIGVYGLDAHRWTERVYKPYSFKIVPGLIKDMTKSLLVSQEVVEKTI